MKGSGMDKPKSALSQPRQHLVELMQYINFGRITRLSIQHCEPVLDPFPGIVREIKFVSENGPRTELTSDDFLLKRQVIELLEFLDKLQDGVIDVLEIKHGLPFRMIVTEVPA